MNKVSIQKWNKNTPEDLTRLPCNGETLLLLHEDGSLSLGDLEVDSISPNDESKDHLVSRSNNEFKIIGWVVLNYSTQVEAKHA